MNQTQAVIKLQSATHLQQKDQTKVTQVKKKSGIQNQIEKIQNDVESQLGELQDKFTEIDQIFKLFIAGWVISYILATKDESECLDQSFEGLAFTFRTWHWVNFSFSISTKAIVLLIIILGTIRCQSGILIRALACLSTLLIIMKVIWIIVGTIILLYYLNFKDCSDIVIMYSSAQFIVFLSALAYYLLKALMKQLLSYLRSENQEQYFRLQLEKLKISYQNRQKDREKTLKEINEISSQIYKSTKKQLAFFGMVGWIFSMAMAQKSSSQCLDEKYQNVSITFRQWLWGDGITTLITMLFFAAFAIIKSSIKDQNKQSQKQNQLSKDNKQGKQQIDMHQKLMDLIKSFQQNKKSAGLLILSALFKFAWLIVGISIFFADLTIKQGTCSGYIVDYLMIYFVQFIFISVVMFTTFCIAIDKKNLKDEAVISEQNNNKRDSKMIKETK